MICKLEILVVKTKHFQRKVKNLILNRKPHPCSGKEVKLNKIPTLAKERLL